MAFDVDVEGLHFQMDADEKFGGRGLGPQPKTLLLASLVGCTGMDVVAILGKMRLTPSRVEGRAALRGALLWRTRLTRPGNRSRQ